MLFSYKYLPSLQLIALILLVVTIFAQCPNSHSKDNGQPHDHGHGHSPPDHGGHSHDAPSFKYSRTANEPLDEPLKPADVQSRTLGSIWFKAIASVFAISCFPLVILFFINVDNTDKHKTALEYLLSFASGGLLGDAFLHLIPHAVMDVDVPSGGQGHGHGHSHSHGHSHGDDAVHAAHIGIGAWVLSGILAFLLVEVVMRSIRNRSGHSHGHSHFHSQEGTDSKPVNDSPISAPPQKRPKNESGDSDSSVRRRTNSRSRSQASSDQEQKKPGHVTKHKASDEISAEKEEMSDEDKEIVEPHDMRVAAYLNLAADFTHNFTDGLAVGAGFLVGDGIGILTAITVILHEIPHEIGDYAILVKSGCSRWRAIGLQLVTAIGALLGTILALGLGATSGAVSWILPFTAGGFIYIATVSVLPELLDSGATLGQAICQLISLLVGVGLMVLVIFFE